MLSYINRYDLALTDYSKCQYHKIKLCGTTQQRALHVKPPDTPSLGSKCEAAPFCLSFSIIIFMCFNYFPIPPNDVLHSPYYERHSLVSVPA